MPTLVFPFLLKGALIYFNAPMLTPEPNMIVFQYNPESMARSFTPWAAPAQSVVAERNARGKLESPDDLRAYGETLAKLSQPYDPAETFSLALEFDAADMLEFPELNPMAVQVGVADRLAALEMLLYPSNDGSADAGLQPSPASTLSTDNPAQLKSDVAKLEADLKSRDAPIVLFFWGPGRIVPVRIQSLTIDEQQYSATLYPTRAKATIGLRVLDLDDLTQLSADPARKGATELARACYSHTLARKRSLARDSVSISRGSGILGMLPI